MPPPVLDHLWTQDIFTFQNIISEHNEDRNVVHDHARRAGSRPELEKQGLLTNLGWPEKAGRRPADTLLVNVTGLQLRNASNLFKVALDFAYVNPQNQSHLNTAANTRLGLQRSIQILREDTRTQINNV